jgi:hypothetical protein
VEDTHGDVTSSAATITVSYVEVPTSFSLDPHAGRVVGFSDSMTHAGRVETLQWIVESTHRFDQPPAWFAAWAPHLTGFDVAVGRMLAPAGRARRR